MPSLAYPHALWEAVSFYGFPGSEETWRFLFYLQDVAADSELLIRLPN